MLAKSFRYSQFLTANYERLCITIAVGYTCRCHGLGTLFHIAGYMPMASNAATADPIRKQATGAQLRDRGDSARRGRNRAWWRSVVASSRRGERHGDEGHTAAILQD